MHTSAIRSFSLASLWIAAPALLAQGGGGGNSIIELTTPTADMSRIDVDDLSIGRSISVADLNAVGDSLGSTLAQIEAYPIAGASVTRYDSHARGGRGLALTPANILEPVAAPSGLYRPFSLRLRMGGPVRELGIATGDYMGSIGFTFRAAGIETARFESSTFGDGSLCWLQAATPFDEVVIEPRPATSFTVTDLCIEKSGYGPFAEGCTSPGSPSLRALGDARPRIGRRFELEVARSSGDGLVGLLWGFSREQLPGGPALPLDLSPLGAPGCQLLTDPAVVMSGATTSGTATFFFDLPGGGDCLGMTFYNQAFTLDATTNALGASWSPGAIGVVRW